MANTESEVWRNISTLGIITDGKGKEVDMSVYSDYEVSNMGRVRSLNYYNTGRKHIKKLTPYENGYLRVTLRYKGKSKDFLIHRLVGYVFIPNPNDYPQINHINERKDDNRVENLEWCDAKQNCNHGTRTERRVETYKTSEKWKQGIKRRAIKQSKQVYQYDKDYNLVRIYESTHDADRNGFKQSNVSSCCNGKIKTYKGFIWSFTLL